MDNAKSIDFDRVADLYDAHVSTSFDHGFWLEIAKQAAGPRLELMCGSGRITMPILRAGIELEGLDYSSGLLEEFRRKLQAERLQTELYRADARSFTIGKKYGLIFIGFHAIAEVVDDRDKVEVFRRVHRHLRDDGSFWLSLHNPPVRRQTIDGKERSFGIFRLPNSDQELEVTGEYHLDEASEIVSGTQRYLITADGKLTKRLELPVRFHLIQPTRLMTLLGEANFRVEKTLGDYDGSPFNQATSSYLLISCTGPGGM